MTVQAFTGGAGCGKTHQLMQSLIAHLDAMPLADGQKVLALTFMHGSRRRLEARLGELHALRERTDCSTIDSFAWRLVRRWLSLAVRLGHANIEPNQYERVCDAAGDLLQIHEVRGWVAASFPVLILDEAQDLTPNRLRLIEGLAIRLHVFAAADEFQCLDEALRPNPACTWLDKVCPPKELSQPRRTNVAELLDAATAIRNGLPPTSGKRFKIQLTSSSALAGAWLSGNLSWFGGGKSVAVITPTLGSFAKAALTWSANNKTSKGAGPYEISWEASEAKAASRFLAGLALKDVNDAPSVVKLLAAAGDPRAARDVSDWMDLQRRARSKITFSRMEIEKAIEQGFAQRRRVRKVEGRSWRGMTVHGAKNREFDNVVVLWPAAVAGSNDQKRRLLYNAVTRAKERCLVLVQASAHVNQPPFA
ncbi:MAG: ATP-dependent helicase [Proteobacteria bacterium]|nr:ATP-dependent helicase [Pseudomonadota bacterium]